jgi:DNA modification methylase
MEYIELSKLKKLPNNPRVIKDKQFKTLVKSIQDNPDYFEARPIICSDRTGELVIIAGNQRYEAARSLKLKKAPVHILTGLTEDREKEIIIRDNISNGSFDWDLLANEWDQEKLIEWGVEIPDFAFKQEAVEDDYEIPDEIETDIVLGDLFEIGQNRLLCGDSTDSEQVARLMNGQKADLVFTDPPYGVEIGAKNRFLNSFQPSGRNLKDIKDDNISKDDLYTKLVSAFTNLRNVSNDCCTYFVTAPQGGELGLMMMMMMEAGLKVRHVLMWYKNSPTFSMGRLDYEYQHEPILLTWNKRHKFYGGGQFKTSVWKIDKPRSNKEHPTMKPIALIENAMLNNSTQGDIVVDIYGGSGSTMVAGHQLSRKVFMQEIDPKYCQVIIDRMRKLDPEIVIKKNGVIYTD